MFIMPEPIFITTMKGHKIRILSPFDYDNMVKVIDKPYLATIFNIARWTGMRYEEIRRLYEHPEWVLIERRHIHLNPQAQRKVKRKERERHVPIPVQIENELKYFFKNQKPPTLQTWDVNLKRWGQKAGLGTVGISAKMTRATLETWMLTAGLTETEICLRQGHTLITSLNHYQSLPSLFTPVERFEIIKRLAGWKQHGNQY